MIPDKHNERCRECKLNIKRLLEKLYGRVEKNYKFDAGTKPVDYKNFAYYETLETILAALEHHRNFRNFIGTPVVPPVDFFIPNPGFILEFDESQHFSKCREIALENYPESLQIGFDRDRWIWLCQKIHARDNDPPDRDERRAWYDTLRDFLPIVKGLRPTIRLYAASQHWCRVDPAVSSDLEAFKRILGT